MNIWVLEAARLWSLAIVSAIWAIGTLRRKVYCTLLNAGGPLVGGGPGGAAELTLVRSLAVRLKPIAFSIWESVVVGSALALTKKLICVGGRTTVLLAGDHN